ncbi:UspA domain-containing protein [Natrialba hulunbeirensis JCM 10989]|uniref:UspA domain-containing protein n=1 Tax=Natrialba hulunbeirensis JCM 10989 TaxID=1227493 RepID=M0A5K5_9EURY|nr:universal stress protein [Natrialba hulunbeirensis]ELY93849.1 UspA domain-containing protein [Natrialba hulunbeirensis JCM 10989]
MTDRVLVPYDGSEPATVALDFALETYPDGDLTALYVIPIPELDFERLERLDGPDFTPPVSDQAREYAARVLEEATGRAGAADCELDTEIAAGKPDRRIVERAQEGVDVVVIGSHGRTSASRVLLGSVAERVVRRAPVPVTVVR